MRRRVRIKLTKLIYEGYGVRMLALRGQAPEGYTSPSTLSYGTLVREYTYWRRYNRWLRGYCHKPAPRIGVTIR
jgi:hypothetical protein